MHPSPATELVLWSTEKQQRLQEQLTGFWAEDVWHFPYRDKHGHGYSLHFTLASAPLQTEFKYALWRKFVSGECKLESPQHDLGARATWLMQWFNQISSPVSSLLERGLEYWEVSLRSDLVQMGQWRPRQGKRLLTTQEYRTTVWEDGRISLLQFLYKTLLDAYDDRAETEKDIWDRRKLGVTVNPTHSSHLLNFTLIPQLWLRQLAKKFIQYDLSIHPGSGEVRLQAILTFSRFLAQNHPTLDILGINRDIIVSYLSYLPAQKLAENTRRRLLISLRIFLETCAYRLGVEELPKERLIFDDELPKEPESSPRDIPEVILVQLREHLQELPTTMLRMVTILLECGMRISELCSLPIDCLKYDDQHEWYLSSYLWKRRKDHMIPLVNQTVVAAIQAQQEEIKARWGQECPHLFPRATTHQKPFHQATFRHGLNVWAHNAKIHDQAGKLYHFTAHPFRHTVGMRLINEDVPIDTISRLFGHGSTKMTQRYAEKRMQTIREELLRAGLKRKTVNYQGQAVKGDPLANSLEPQLLRKGIRGQTLPVGGCGRLVVSGPCEHANKCVTCTFWLTSTEDLPTLKSFLHKAIRLRQRAVETGNELVVRHQDQIIPHLQLRTTSLEQQGDEDEAFSLEEILRKLKTELAQMEAGLEEAREAQLVIALKHFEQRIGELKAQIAALEGEW